jgi:hypothetical protein
MLGGSKVPSFLALYVFTFSLALFSISFFLKLIKKFKFLIIVIILIVEIVYFKCFGVFEKIFYRYSIIVHHYIYFFLNFFLTWLGLYILTNWLVWKLMHKFYQFIILYNIIHII